jgi:hypothetical protein
MAQLLLSKVPIVVALRATWHDLRHRIAHPYHPERHYMRGPGPKARSKRRD